MAEFRIPLDYKEKVGRAAHNLTKPVRSTMHPGLLYPMYYRRMKRGEKLIFDTPQMLLQSQPTFAPVMGSYRLRVEWYFNSDTNHYGWIDNNSRLTTEEVLNRKHHTFVPRLKSFEETLNKVDEYDDAIEYFTVNKFGVGRGSLLDFAGIAPCYQPLRKEDRENRVYGVEFNLDMILTYLNIIRTYHVNQQFPDVPYVANDIYLYGDNVPGVGRFNFSTYSQKDLDELFMALRLLPNGFCFGLGTYPSSQNIPTRYRGYLEKFVGYLENSVGAHGGLFCSQYQPDLYRNLLSSDIDLYKSTIQVNDDGSFSIDTFRFDNRIQKILDRINPFGGKDSTLSRTRWGVTSKKDYDQPIYICSHTEYIDTTAIISNNAGSSPSNDVESVPGSLSGNVNQRKFPKGTKQSFTAEVPGTLMAIVSVVPIVDYSQNIEHWLLQNNFEDEFSPQMAQRGFEDVPLTDYCALPQFVKMLDVGESSTESYILDIAFDDVVGKQIAWIHDMTDNARVHGEFSNYGYFNTWVLSRQYGIQRSLSLGPNNTVSAFDYKVDITPYVNPLDWQYPFVPQTLKDPNWYFQCLFDVKTISPVGYRFMPTLE